jgi:hypothetical protein
LLALLFIVVSHSLTAMGEAGRAKDDFPPEVDYPDEAYESEDSEAGEDYLQPKELRDRKKKRAPKDKPRARVEKTPLPDEPPSRPSLWSFDLESLFGLNQVGATPTIDPNRDAVGLTQSFLMGGRVGLFRGSWGFELDGRYAFTPLQEVIFPTEPPTVQNRSLRTLSALASIAYRYRLGGPTGRFQLIARVGYGLVAVTQEIESSTGTIPHHAQVGALYLGAGLEAQWLRWWSTQIDFYQSMVGGGRLAPTDAPAGSAGFGYYLLNVSNRFRLLTWGESASTKSFGVGSLITLQQLSTPVPPTGSLVGDAETSMQILGTAYFSF